MNFRDFDCRDNVKWDADQEMQAAEKVSLNSAEMMSTDRICK